MKDAIVAMTVLTYDLLLVAGTAYLVQVHDWSMWTFLLSAMFFVTTAKTTKE